MECVERGLDPLDTCLVVADESRTQKTICLAVSPALKSFGTGGRPRLFEVVQKVNKVNSGRGRKGKSFSAKVLKERDDYQVDFLIAPPRMAHYIDYSSRIFDIYLRFVSSEDIHVYSIDEVFIDVTDYLNFYNLSAHQLAIKIIKTVLSETGITATAGIGTNLYLSKVAMDIVAKKMPADADGVRIAELDEKSYRHELWDHRPLTDFWRVGHGIANKLALYGIYTMGDIALQSMKNDALFYNLFGVNAELLIDHAWGWEPVTIKQVKDYRPETKSISSGQVLQEPYTASLARNVVLEMADAVAYELVEKGLVTDQLVLTVGYDVESLIRPEIKNLYKGRIKTDFYGRKVPEHAHGTINIEIPTSSATVLVDKTAELFDRIINPDLLVRRLTLSINHLLTENKAKQSVKPIQLDLFSDFEETIKKHKVEEEVREREHRQQLAMLELRKKYGKNIILRGLNFSEGATQRSRNSQIGGHKA